MSTIDTGYFRVPELYKTYWDRVVIWNSSKQTFITDYSKLVIPTHEYRSSFSSDRDKILYCNPFLRLSLKTQVFRAGENDHLRTRLTHTLEVSQIARTIAEVLRLDVNLTEAIALGHDVGHTPFGHAGERTLNEISQDEKAYVKTELKVNEPKIQNYKGFKHNHQSVRRLIDFSNRLSITNFCLFGIRNHSSLNFTKLPDNDMSFYNIYDRFCSFEYNGNYLQSWSIEAYIVFWADEIAQRHHNLEDASNSGLLNQEQIFNIFSSIKKDYPKLMTKGTTYKFNCLKAALKNRDQFSRRLSSFVVDLYVTAFIKEFRRTINEIADKFEINSREDFVNKYPTIHVNDISDSFKRSTSTGILEFDEKLESVLDGTIVPSYAVQRQDGRGGFLIRRLISAYITNPQQLPDSYIKRIFTDEVPWSFNSKNMKTLFACLNNTSYPEDVTKWGILESRKALRVLWIDSVGYQIIYPLVFRVIFDHISAMTDSYAQEEYTNLYSNKLH